MHCGASLNELQGALVFHRKCQGKRLGHQMYMLVFVEECSMGTCSSWHVLGGNSGVENGVENGME